jgi:hypothetical protein
MIPDIRKKEAHQGHPVSPKSLANLRPRRKGDPPRGKPCNGAMKRKIKLAEMLDELAAEVPRDKDGKPVADNWDLLIWRGIRERAARGEPWACTMWVEHKDGRPMQRIEATGKDGAALMGFAEFAKLLVDESKQKHE